MADISAAINALINAIGILAGGTSPSMTVHREIQNYLDIARNEVLTRYYITDSVDNPVRFGQDESRWINSIEEARRAISYYFDVTHRAHNPFYTIWDSNGNKIEKVEREPEDE